MKKLLLPVMILVILALSQPLFSFELKNFQGNERQYYGIKINDILCGYVIMDISNRPPPNENELKIEQDILLMSTALGMSINTKIKNLIFVNKYTERISYFDMIISQGQTKVDIKSEVKNDTVYYTSSLVPTPKITYLPPNVITDNPYYSSFIKKDFIEGNADKKTYKMYDFQSGEIVNAEFYKKNEESIELAGKKYNAVLIEQIYPKSQVKISSWFDKSTGFGLRSIIMGSRDIFLTDKSVIKKIQVADLDKNLFVKTNKSIADISSLIYMKVKAELEPVGMKLGPEDLNFNNQKFTGTVKDNIISGIFEVRLEKYDGENAPLFPHDYSAEVEDKYLSPGDRIESEDSVLINSARHITENAKTTWDAVILLTKWVSENIDYVIPGGISARDTYDRRIGECGAHSLLLAGFCRAVGIPARVVWGCMYVPNYGGAFGQHGWTEVYINKENGWIQIDATANEIGFADAGHIRIGELDALSVSLNPKKMEIIDYSIKARTDSINLEELYAAELGDYYLPEKNEVFHLVILDGSLTLDIPNKIKLALKKADDKGRMYAKLSNLLFVTFPTDEENEINYMNLHQLINVKKTASPENIPENVPEKFRTFLGTYSILQLGKTFTVQYANNNIFIHDNSSNKDIHYKEPDSEGWRLEKNGKNYIKFNLNANGEVESYTLDYVIKLFKGKLAAVLIDEIIQRDGIEAGINKLFELKNNNNKEYLIMEKSINSLGYKYVNNKKYKEAIAIFEANTKLYPLSGNAFDSLGDAYMKDGQKEKAIKNYSKSLEINPGNGNAKKMLEKLQK